MNEDDYYFIEAAYHEIGHSLANYIVFDTFTDVSILEGYGCSDNVDFPPVDEDDIPTSIAASDDYRFKNICVSIAGYVAEEYTLRHRDINTLSWDEMCSHHTYEGDVSDCIAVMDENKIKGVFGRAVLTLIENPVWDAIDKIADKAKSIYQRIPSGIEPEVCIISEEIEEIVESHLQAVGICSDVNF